MEELVKIDKIEEINCGLEVIKLSMLSKIFAIIHIHKIINIIYEIIYKVCDKLKGVEIMSSIKDYAKQSNQNKRTEIKEEDLKKTQDDYSDLIELFMSKYGTLSEDELIAEMLKLIQQKKANGTFDGRKLRELAERVAPFLTPEQRSKMYDMMNYLD